MVTEQSKAFNELKVGEHVIAFWIEGSKAIWHLGVVEDIKNGNPIVSYMVRKDTSGKSWTYPECAEILEISQDQVCTDQLQYFK